MSRPLERIWDWLLNRGRLTLPSGRVGRPTMHNAIKLSDGIHATPSDDGAWILHYKDERWMLEGHRDGFTPADLLNVRTAIDKGENHE